MKISKTNNNRFSINLALTFTGIFLIITIVLIIILLANENSRVANAKEAYKETTSKIAKEFNEEFESAMSVTEELAEKLSNENYSEEEIEDMLKGIMKDMEKIYGVAVAYDRFLYDEDIDRFERYYCRKDGKVARATIKYNYTDKEEAGNEWFVKPMENGKGWTTPYYGETSETLVDVYSVPFTEINNSNKNKGVVIIVYSVENMKSITSELAEGSEKYFYLVSKDEKVLTHPSIEYSPEHEKLIYHKNIMDENIKDLNIDAVLNGEITERIIDEDKDDNKETIIYYEPINSANYVLGNVYILDGLFDNNNEIRPDLIRITIAFLFFIISLGMVYIFTKDDYKSKLQVSYSLAIVLAVLIGVIWSIALKYDEGTEGAHKKVTNDAAVADYINEKESKEDKSNDNKLLIPTGLFIQSLEFVNANNVKLTGYIWQKYGKDIPDDVSKGFIFPEAIELTEREAYNFTLEDETEVQGWYFETVLRQKFDYSKYPLDNKDVWIRLWHKDFHKDIVLVPDFKSYTLENDKKIETDDDLINVIGIENQIVLSGWDIDDSFFSYVENSYNTNFGIEDYKGQVEFPELYFSIIVNRKFTDPFITNLLPFIVMAFILFGTLVLIFTDESKLTKYGVSALGVLLGNSALFFAVLIAHSGLRERINTSGILYLEYFYFAMYAAIILVIINAFYIAFNIKSKIISYGDNLLPKVLFWPLLLGVLYVITVITFI